MLRQSKLEVRHKYQVTPLLDLCVTSHLHAVSCRTGHCETQHQGAVPHVNTLTIHLLRCNVPVDSAHCHNSEFNLDASVLFCSVLFCSVLFCSVLFCSVLQYQ